MLDITFEIIKTIGVLSESSKGWKKELNLISWNGNEPKYDIREWSPDHAKMGKGVTFTKEDLLTLKHILENLGITGNNDDELLDKMMKAQADLKLTVAKIKLSPYFVQTNPGWFYKNNLKIYYLYDYVPTYQYNYRNKSEDAVSISNDLLKYKEAVDPYHKEFTMSFLNGIIEISKEFDREYIALVGIPSSTIDGISPVIKSIETLSSLAEEIKLVHSSFDKHLLNFSWVIQRRSDVHSLHNGGNRNSELIEKSLSCGTFKYDDDTAYFILDDICTTGASMQAVTNLLMKNNVPASSIYRLVLGRTSTKFDYV